MRRRAALAVLGFACFFAVLAVELHWRYAQLRIFYGLHGVSGRAYRRQA